MGFPQINVNQPSGQDYISSIDEFERQTRQWLKQCMETISGYPDIDTVAVKAWSSNPDPRYYTQPSAIRGKYLLGYDTYTEELQVIAYDEETDEQNKTKVLGLAKQVVLSMYPVGSYYETSDATFNPNTEWGGTWVEDTTGRVLVARGRITRLDSNDNTKEEIVPGSNIYSLDETTDSNNHVLWSEQGAGKGGEEKHDLSRPELPSSIIEENNGHTSELPIHYHPHRHPHTHAISGNFLQEFVQESGSEETPTYYITTNNNSEGIGVIVNREVKSELPTKEDYAYSMGEANNADAEIGWFPLQNSSYTLHGMVDADTLSPNEASAQNPRNISEDLLMHVGSTIGQNGHNNIQPYQVVVRWHRIA